jgi:hypothetical protein
VQCSLPSFNAPFESLALPAFTRPSVGTFTSEHCASANPAHATFDYLLSRQALIVFLPYTTRIAHTHSKLKSNCSRLACPHRHPSPCRDRSREPRPKLDLKSQSRWRTVLTYLRTTASAASSNPIYQVDQILQRTALQSRPPDRAHQHRAR